MTIVNHLIKNAESEILNLKDGLDPENIGFWFQKIIKETKTNAPPWLCNKIAVIQNPILPMKFKIDISKRAVQYFMISIDANLDSMPYSTRLYFLKVQEILSDEMDKSLV